MLVDDVDWGRAHVGNLAIAIPVAMLAYTGGNRLNLAEEAREPERSVPNAYKLVAVAVFAIYFTLPLIALSALPREGNRRPSSTTLLALPPEQGGYANDPILGVVDNLGLEGRCSTATPGLRRDPRRDDPLHRHERRDHRRLADHVLDGDVPADAGGLPQARPTVQDPYLSLDPVRGSHRS